MGAAAQPGPPPVAVPPSQPVPLADFMQLSAAVPSTGPGLGIPSMPGMPEWMSRSVGPASMPFAAPPPLPCFTPPPMPGVGAAQPARLAGGCACRLAGAACTIPAQQLSESSSQKLLSVCNDCLPPRAAPLDTRRPRRSRGSSRSTCPAADSWPLSSSTRRNTARKWHHGQVAGGRRR